MLVTAENDTDVDFLAVPDRAHDKFVNGQNPNWNVRYGGPIGVAGLRLIRRLDRLAHLAGRTDCLKVSCRAQEGTRTASSYPSACSLVLGEGALGRAILVRLSPCVSQGSASCQRLTLNQARLGRRTVYFVQSRDGDRSVALIVNRFALAAILFYFFYHRRPLSRLQMTASPVTRL